MKRYQDCNWLVKLWRRRHYLLIPFQTLHIIWKKWINPYKRENDERFPVKLYWDIAKADAEVKVNWYYTQDDIDDILEEIKNNYERLNKDKEMFAWKYFENVPISVTCFDETV